MAKESFDKLFDIIKPEMTQGFHKSAGSRITKRKKSTYHIELQIRLSAAIMLSHGISHFSVDTSVWGVVDYFNYCEDLQFQFPASHDEQKEISSGFKHISGTFFDCVIECIDGMLIWTTKPSKKRAQRRRIR